MYNMGSSEMMITKDEPLTPTGRLFIRPEMNQVVNCAFGFKNPIDMDSIKSNVPPIFFCHNLRFSSLLVHDQNGVEHWRRITVDVDSHVIVLDHPVSPTGTDDQTAVNAYMAELATSALETSKPLWEFHYLKAHNCLIIRFHHALGDGISLMTLVLACCRRIDDVNKLPTVVDSSGAKNRTESSCSSSGGRRRRNMYYLWEVFLGFMKMVFFSLVYVVEFLLRSMWVCDYRTTISGGNGVELWPREVTTASFSLLDMKAVKKAIPNATINDVLFGIISSGLSRYLDHRSPNALQEGLQITGLAMVNLRQQADNYISTEGNPGPPRWGNKFGYILLPVYYHKGGADPLHYLRRAKVMMDRKKQSLEAHFSYKISTFLMSLVGSKFCSLLNYRIVCNTSFTISNVPGPLQEIAFEGNPINFIRVTSSSIPHGLIMHMVSYAGRADMQISVAKDVIPDPEFLANCFETALLEMKEATAFPCTKL